MDRPKFRSEYRNKNRFVWDPLLDNMWINRKPGSASEVAREILAEYNCADIKSRMRPTYYRVTADVPSNERELIVALQKELTKRFCATVKRIQFAGKPRIQIHIPRDVA